MFCNTSKDKTKTLIYKISAISAATDTCTALSDAVFPFDGLWFHVHFSLWLIWQSALAQKSIRLTISLSPL